MQLPARFRDSPAGPVVAPRPREFPRGRRGPGWLPPCRAWSLPSWRPAALPEVVAHTRTASRCYQAAGWKRPCTFRSPRVPRPLFALQLAAMPVASMTGKRCSRRSESRWPCPPDLRFVKAAGASWRQLAGEVMRWNGWKVQQMMRPGRNNSKAAKNCGERHRTSADG